MLRLPIVLLAIAALPAFAEEAAPCAMTYAQYDFAVPHLDIDNCPDALAGDGRFCRAAAGGDQLHVYAFEADGEQCLIGMVSLNEDAFTLEVR
ncbi:MAG: hypothetical protein ACFBSD_03040 [Paracoccaceae bacterium]